uniref:G_PROTEIN_RECEP_F1_2 domain-containing protein n=1 Tax=Elaeophora elaphi TaxID=1147741 RepID=A0A0R3RNB6_9BILA
LGILGLLAHGISLYIIRKSPRYNNTFGILFTTYVLFHIQTAIILILWTFIRIFVYVKYGKDMELASISWRIFTRISSPLANSTLYAAIWMQAVLAINRFCAISYPMTYRRMFNRRSAWITVISLWSCSTLITAFYYNMRCNEFVFSLSLSLSLIAIWVGYISYYRAECVVYCEANTHSWSTLCGPCNHTFITYIAILLSDFIIAISLAIDSFAFYRVIAYLKGKRHREANAAQGKYKQEILFFKETCVSTAIYAIFAAIFRIKMPISRLTKITYIWLAILTLDG